MKKRQFQTCRNLEVRTTPKRPYLHRSNNLPFSTADGVEYVVEAGKKVYHKVASSKEDLTEAPAGGNRQLDAEVEWLP